MSGGKTKCSNCGNTFVGAGYVGGQFVDLSDLCYECHSALPNDTLASVLVNRLLGTRSKEIISTIDKKKWVAMVEMVLHHIESGRGFRERAIEECASYLESQVDYRYGSINNKNYFMIAAERLRGLKTKE